MTKHTADIPTVIAASGKARPVKGGSYIRAKDGSLTRRQPRAAERSDYAPTGARPRLAESQGGGGRRPAPEGHIKKEEN